MPTRPSVRTSTVASSVWPATGAAPRFASRGLQGANDRWSATARARSSTSGTSGDRTRLIVRDAHSLYLETFAELGFVGLLLLVGALVAPVLAAIRARRQRLAAAGLGALAAWCAASAFDWHWEMVGVTITALLAAATGLVAAEHGPRRVLGRRARAAAIAAGLALSVFAIWSLVGNQALFAGRDALARRDWASAREHGRRAEGLLVWSAEPEIVLGDAAAGLGDRQAALRSYRKATTIDPRSWVAWLRLAQVARGPERAAAYRAVHELNPLEEGLPGE